MRRITVRATALGLTLFATGWLAWAYGDAADKEKPKQPQSTASADKKGPPSVADLLAEAMKNNPDIRVAETKLQKAEAELIRSRLQVMKAIVTAHHALESQKAQVSFAEVPLKRALRLYEMKAISLEDLEEAKKKLVVEKAKLAAIENELPYLLGRQSVKEKSDAKALAMYYLHLTAAQKAWDDRTVDAGSKAWFGKTMNAGSAARISDSVAAKLRKALNSPLSLNIDAGTPLGQVLENIESQVPGISFTIVNGGDTDIKQTPIDAHFKVIPLGAILQAFEDTVPKIRFAVRDYGVLVTWIGQMPPQAVMVSDFWKETTVKEKPKAASSGTDSGKKP